MQLKPASKVVAFTAAVPFDTLLTEIGAYSGSSPQTFTVNSTGAKSGHSAFCLYTANGGSNEPDLSAFKKVGGKSFDNTNGTINLLTFVKFGSIYAVSFDQPQDIVGASGDTTAPTVIGAVAVDATHIEITFSEPVTSAATTGWSFTKNGSSLAISSVSAISTSKWSFVVATMVAGDTIQRSYAGSTVQDTSANPLAAFTNGGVTNSVSGVTSNIVAIGDSLTEGGGATPFPSTLATSLGRSVSNQGVGGTDTNYWIQSARNALIDGLYDGTKDKNILLVMLGTNDVFESVNISTLSANLIAIVSHAKTTGYEVIVACPPEANHMGLKYGAHTYAGFYTLRQWIFDNQVSLGADEIVDMIDDNLIGQGRYDNINYWYKGGYPGGLFDNVHYGTPGYAEIAAVFQPAVQRVLTSTTKARLNLPQNFTATSLTGQHVQLLWDAVTGATSYRVYRSTSIDRSTAVQVGGTISTNSYNDGSVTSGTRYYYWVQAQATGYTDSSFAIADCFANEGVADIWNWDVDLGIEQNFGFKRNGGLYGGVVNAISQAQYFTGDEFYFKNIDTANDVYAGIFNDGGTQGNLANLKFGISLLHDGNVYGCINGAPNTVLGANTANKWWKISYSTGKISISKSDDGSTWSHVIDSTDFGTPFVPSGSYYFGAALGGINSEIRNLGVGTFTPPAPSVMQFVPASWTESPAGEFTAVGGTEGDNTAYSVDAIADGNKIRVQVKDSGAGLLFGIAQSPHAGADSGTPVTLPNHYGQTPADSSYIIFADGASGSYGGTFDVNWYFEIRNVAGVYTAYKSSDGVTFTAFGTTVTASGTYYFILSMNTGQVIVQFF